MPLIEENIINDKNPIKNIIAIIKPFLFFRVIIS